MDIYYYHPETGEFLGQGLADPSPREPGKWLIPANATTVAPPSAQSGFARVLVENLWTNVPDHRGETWWDANGEPVEIKDFGDPVDQGLTNVEPPAPPAYPTLQAALLAMVSWIEALHASITGPVPQDVKHGWKAKADWARAWDADNAIAVPQTITDEMAAAGDTYRDQNGDLSVQLIVPKIIAKADIYEGVLADTEGLRTKTQDELEAAEADTANTDPFKFDTILAARQAEAVQMAAARGISLPTT